MHLIVCVDDRDGMAFCGRRLSRDSEVYAHMLHMTHESLLWLHPDSAGFFPEGSVNADPDFLKKAGVGEYCFAETRLPDLSDSLESVTLYHWNRAYPATLYFDRKLLETMQLDRMEEFPGSSHEKITMERFVP